MLGHEYFRALERSIDRVRGQAPKIADAARLIVDGSVKGGRFYVHDATNMIAIEAEGRAGGLLMLRELPLWKLIELDASSNDVVVVFANGSDSKGEGVFFEELGRRGLKIVGVFPSSAGDHPLQRLSHVVIDNGLKEEGGVVGVPGFKEKVGPIDAPVNSIIIYCLCAEVIEEFLRRGLKPSVYMSMRRSGSRAHNERMVDLYTRQGY